MTSLVIGGIGAQARVEVTGPQAGELRDLLAQAWSRCVDAPQGPAGEPVRIDTAMGVEPAHLLAGITQQVTHA